MLWLAYGKLEVAYRTSKKGFLISRAGGVCLVGHCFTQLE